MLSQGWGCMPQVTVLPREIWRGVRRLLADCRGASLVETALVAPVFLALLFAVLELGALAAESANFHNGVAAVARRIRTGQPDGPFNPGAFVAQVCSEMGEGAGDCASRMSVRVQAYSDFAGAAADAQSLYAGAVQNNGAIAQGAVFNRGGASSIVLVTATYSCFLLVPFAETAFVRTDPTHVLLTDGVLFKSEPYAP